MEAGTATFQLSWSQTVDRFAKVVFASPFTRTFAFFKSITDSVRAMTLLPFTKLDPFSPRQFVPDDADLGDWNQIRPLFDRLETEAANVRTRQEFERWLLQASELSAALDEEGSRRYIAMTCHTD